MTTEPTKRKPWYRRLRLRISIRALIVLVLIIGGGMGWIAHRAKVQRDAVAAIREAGGLVQYDWEYHDDVYTGAPCPWPKWLVDALGIDYLANVTMVQVSRIGNKPPILTDAILGQIGRIRNVESLWLGGNSFTDSGLANLEGLPRLKLLHLTNLGLDGTVMKHLAGLTQLEQLYVFFRSIHDDDLASLSGLRRLKKIVLYSLREPGIGDAGLAHLTPLVELRKLHIGSNQITNEGLSKLRGMVHLESLSLPDSLNLTSLEPIRPLVHLKTILVQGSVKLTDSGLSALASFPDLESLTLQSTPIGDETLKLLQNAKRLNFLILSGTRVTDQGLASLKDLKRLSVLSLEQSRVTSEGVQAFKAAHPKLTISGP